MSKITKTPRTSLSLETLEGRSLMAAGVTATLVNRAGDGILRVVGTDAAETIRVVQSGPMVSVEVQRRVFESAVNVPIKVMTGKDYSDLSAVDRNMVNRVEIYAL